MRTLLFLLLPALASCRISITIQSSSSEDSSSASARGSEADIISDKERTTFGITDEVLKDAAEKYSGGRPADVFLHSPTPWNDLYQTYDWVEVQRVFKPINSRIIDFQTEKLVVNLKEFDNNSTLSTKFDGSVMAEVENIVKNKWNRAGVLEVKEPLVYNVTVSSRFSYTTLWGVDAVQTEKVQIGSSSDVEVVLDPGQSVSAALIATKITMTVQIDYVASLRGHVACNYPKKYNGHHFWRYEINSLMGAAGLIRKLNSSEVISVKFYTDANIVVMDKKTNSKISEIPAKFSDK